MTGNLNTKIGHQQNGLPNILPWMEMYFYKEVDIADISDGL